MANDATGDDMKKKKDGDRGDDDMGENDTPKTDTDGDGM
jgi:hypothetical protein